VSLYKLVTDMFPFTGEAPFAVFAAILQGEVPSLEHHPNCPPELADVLRKCLMKNPDDRYQTAAEMSEALRSVILATSQATAASPIENMVSAKVSSAPKVVLSIAALVVVLGSIAIGIGLNARKVSGNTESGVATVASLVDPLATVHKETAAPLPSSSLSAELKTTLPSASASAVRSAPSHAQTKAPVTAATTVATTKPTADVYDPTATRKR
jgi:serine/threonine protein kinase